MLLFLQIYRIVRELGLVEYPVIATLNKHLSTPIKNEKGQRALQDLEHAQLVVIERNKNGRTAKVTACDQLPNIGQVQGMSRVGRIVAVYVILALEHDPRLESPLPTEGLQERIGSRFPELSASLVVSEMLRYQMIPRPKR